MLTSDIREELMALSGCTREQAKAVTDAFLAIIEKGLLEDGMVELHGLCRLKVQARAPQRVHNPQTGEPMSTGATKRIRAFASVRMRQKLMGVEHGRNEEA